MKEYRMQITLWVDAHDYDEAVDIAKEVCETIKTESIYKFRGIEADKIEEV